jgi:outer membrane protein TolC
VDRRTGRLAGPGGVTEDEFDVVASLRLVDSGERAAALAGARRSAEAEALRALQTLREILFQVQRQYYDALRAERLLTVQEAQLKRAELILEQTRTRVDVGDAPRKDILQAQADALNARASVLAARNRVVSTFASLKATLGWNEAETPRLAPLPDDFQLAPLETTLAVTIDEGLKARADLGGQRRDIEASQADARLARIQSGVQVTLDANYARSFDPDVLDNRALVLRATIPLYDGRRSEETARARRLATESQLARLSQSERDARAEIEAAYIEYGQNIDRLEASRSALAAARVNFEAAQEAQRLGAGDLLSVSTAQVSLVTAESNFVESLFDAAIAEARLRLATGVRMTGED